MGSLWAADSTDAYKCLGVPRFWANDLCLMDHEEHFENSFTPDVTDSQDLVKKKKKRPPPVVVTPLFPKCPSPNAAFKCIWWLSKVQQKSKEILKSASEL